MMLHQPQIQTLGVYLDQFLIFILFSPLFLDIVEYKIMYIKLLILSYIFHCMLNFRVSRIKSFLLNIEIVALGYHRFNSYQARRYFAI